VNLRFISTNSLPILLESTEIDISSNSPLFFGLHELRHRKHPKREKRRIKFKALFLLIKFFLEKIILKYIFVY